MISQEGFVPLPTARTARPFGFWCELRRTPFVLIGPGLGYDTDPEESTLARDGSKLSRVYSPLKDIA
jgi:hypothetical protein